MLPGRMKTLVRCAGSSLAGVAAEFVLLSFLVSVLHLFYLVAATGAGVAGFVVSFVLNRRWAFDARHGSPWPQLVRHGVVVGGGLGIGLALMWLLVGGLGLPYQIGWLGGGALVFFAWTFPMQRFFTYRAPAPSRALAA